MKALGNHVFREHVVIGGIAALLLLPVFGPWGSFFFWVANILIDIDHYLNFLFRTRFQSIGPLPMFRYFEKVFAQRHQKNFLAIEVFHTVEFMALFSLVAFAGPLWVRPVFWGAAFHMVVDLVHLARYRMLTKRVHSVVEYWIRMKKMKQRGFDPEAVYQEAGSIL